MSRPPQRKIHAVWRVEDRRPSTASSSVATANVLLFGHTRVGRYAFSVSLSSKARKRLKGKRKIRVEVALSGQAVITRDVTLQRG